MKKFMLWIFLQIIWILPVSSQIDLDKIKNLTNINRDNVKEFAKEQLIELLKKSRDEYDVTDFNYAVSFGDNSSLYETEEKFNQSKKILLYALEPENAKDRTEIQKAKDMNDVGEMLYASGKFKSAEKAFERAYELYESSDNISSKDAALTISNMGLLYQSSGRYEKAKEYNERALALREQSKEDDAGYGASLNNLGVLYKDMGLYTKAEEYLNESEEYLKTQNNGQGTSYCIVINNLAMLYQATGKYKEAEELLKKSIELAGADWKEKSPNYIRLKVNLALLYQLTKRYKDAELIYQEAIAIKKKKLGTKHPDYAVLISGLAGLYQVQGINQQKTEELLLEAAKINQKKLGDDHPSYATSLFNLASFYQSIDKPDQALPHLQKAIDIQKTQLGEHHPAYINSCENLAILFWQKKDISNSANTYRQVLQEYLYQINTYFSAMNEYEKSKFWEKIHPKFIRYFSFALENYSNEPEIIGDFYNYHIATKALLLSSTRKVKNRILNSGNTDLIRMFTKWSDLKSYLAKLYTYSVEELQEEKINLDSLENESKIIEKELNKISDFASATQSSNVTFENIAENLNPNEAAIEFIRVARYNKMKPDTAISYVALVVKKDSKLPEIVVFKNGKNMETNFARSYRKTVQGSGKMEKFYPYYWGELEHITANFPNLYVSVDGIYNQINLNTLQKSDGKFLVEEKSIRYVTNTNDIIGLKKKPKANAAGLIGKNAVLIGFPDYQLDMDKENAKIAALPGTKIELDNINVALKKKNWTITQLMEKKATEESVKQVKNPYVLHIATHGFFFKDVENTDDKFFGLEPIKAAENPLLRSGLLFAGADKTVNNINMSENKDADDGILNAYEAMILNLDNTELVVLSACETGLGEIVNGEGVYGLQRSFQIAGTASILMSLWEVSDEGTQNLMEAFYKYWLLTGDKYEAMLKAQLDMKEKFKLPFYWGAFVLISQ